MGGCQRHDKQLPSRPDHPRRFTQWRRWTGHLQKDQTITRIKSYTCNPFFRKCRAWQKPGKFKSAGIYCQAVRTFAPAENDKPLPELNHENRFSILCMTLLIGPSILFVLSSMRESSN